MHPLPFYFLKFTKSERYGFPMAATFIPIIGWGTVKI